MVILTDIHGNYDTMLALLAQIPQEEKDAGIVIAGDLVDRGPKSSDVIQYCMDNKISVVCGNHEEMMIQQGIKQADHFTNKGCFDFGVFPTQNAWTFHNGGYQTMSSYVEDDGKGSITVQLNRLKEHVEWLKTLPYYLEYKDVKNDKGEHLLVTHSSASSVWGWSEERRKNMYDQFIGHLAWGRPHTIHAIPNIFNVFGHTPCENGPKIKSCYANIDTGCFFTAKPGYGVLTALSFPSMKIWQQPKIDIDPVKKREGYGY